MSMRPLVMVQGELFDIPVGGPKGPSTESNDPMPPGPYALSMLYDMELQQYVVPFSVVGVDGKTVAAHIPSLEIAKAVRDALNHQLSAPTDRDRASRYFDPLTGDETAVASPSPSPVGDR